MLPVHLFSQCKGSNVTPTIIVIISPVPSNGIYMYIRATTEAHTDIVDALLSINGADTVASKIMITSLKVVAMSCMHPVNIK